MSGMFVQDDVRPNEFFKLRIKTKAPRVNKHYSAGYMLLDNEGNYFGDKVVLDVIVEDDCSDAVILAEMMDNVDMSVRNEPNFNKVPLRDERKSMMINRPNGHQNQPPRNPMGAPSFGGPNM